MPHRTYNFITDAQGNRWKILYKNGVENGRELANPGAQELTEQAFRDRKTLLENPVKDLLTKPARDFTPADIAQAIKYLLRLAIETR